VLVQLEGTGEGELNGDVDDRLLVAPRPVDIASQVKRVARFDLVCEE
jgi:hypothetical protein